MKEGYVLSFKRVYPLPKIQQEIYNIIKTHGPITSEKITFLSGHEKNKVGRVITRLLDKDKIKVIGTCQGIDRIGRLSNHKNLYSAK